MPFTPADADGVASIILPIQQREFGIGIGLDDQPDLRDIPGFYERAAGFPVMTVDSKFYHRPAVARAT